MNKELHPLFADLFESLYGVKRESFGSALTDDQRAANVMKAFEPFKKLAEDYPPKPFQAFDPRMNEPYDFDNTLIGKEYFECKECGLYYHLDDLYNGYDEPWCLDCLQDDNNGEMWRCLGGALTHYKPEVA